MSLLVDTADVVAKEPAFSPWYVDDEGHEHFAVAWYCVFGGVEYGNILAGTSPVDEYMLAFVRRLGRTHMERDYGWVPRYGHWRPW